MTIHSFGFPDTIAPGSVWAELHRSGGRIRGFNGPNELRVTNTVERAVDIQPGALYAHGIYLWSDAATRIPLPEVVSGSQYFMLVVDIRWNDDGNGYRAEFQYVPGTAARAYPSSPVNPGVRAMVPIALARITAGAPTPTEIVDLRGIQTTAGEYQIYDDLALDLYGFSGAVVYNVTTQVQRTRRADPHYGLEWQATSPPRPRGSREFSSIATSANWSTNPDWSAGAKGVLRAFPLGDVTFMNSPGPADWLVEVELVCSYHGVGSPITATSSGMLADVNFATIIDERLRPQGTMVATTAFVATPTSGSCHGGIAILPTGAIVLTDLPPSQTVKSVPALAGVVMNPRPEASLRLRANWVVRGVTL